MVEQLAVPLWGPSDLGIS